MLTRWLPLLLLSSYAAAFYPYNDGDGGKVRRFVPLDIEPRPEQGAGGVTVDIQRRRVGHEPFVADAMILNPCPE
jgi:hypothetical protein